MTLPKFQTAIEIINEVIVPQVDANTKDIQAITKEVISNEKSFKKDVTDIYNTLEKKEEATESKMEVSRAEYTKYCKELEAEIKNLSKQITSDKSEEDLGKIVDELSVKVEALENEENFEYDDQELKEAVTKLNVDFGVFKEKVLTSKSVIDEINSQGEIIEASSIKGLVSTLNNIANLGGNSNVKISAPILEVLSSGSSIMQGVSRLNFIGATVAYNKGTVDITVTGGGGGTPGGADTNIQFNDAGTFGGDSKFSWNKTNKTLIVGSTLGYATTDLLESLVSSTNSYNQLLIQNTNGGAAASSDIVVNNDVSTNTTFYGDFGMNSSGFTGTGSLSKASAVYLSSTSGDLVLGTTTANAIRLVTNSGATDALIVDSSNNVNLPGATASTIAIFDSSKNLISATTATYPSLTELSYVKGVTSSIQTQLNAKGAGTVTNTGGSLTANSIVLGAGTNDTKVVAGITTDGTSIINLGVNTTTAGKIKLFGGTSGDVTILGTAAAGTATTQTLPATSGTLVNRVTTGNGVSATNTDGALAFTLGAITPSTVNGNTITTGTGTLTLGAGKTATISNTLTFTGTDSSSVAFGAGGTVLYANQSITLSGAVTGSGTTAITTTIATPGTLTAATTNSTATAHTHAITTATAPTASTIVSFDANSNLSANNSLEGFTTTATAAGTTTMTIASTYQQVWTGSSTQTVKLPTTSVPQGGSYYITNNSTGSVTVQSSGANTIQVLGAGMSGIFTAIVATPTTAANWDCQLFETTGVNIAVTASGNAATVNLAYKTTTITNNSAATLTVTIPTAGAIDGEKRTFRIFPSSAVAQTLTLVNTENSATVSAPANTGASTTIPLEIGVTFNAATTKWTVVAYA